MYTMPVKLTYHFDTNLYVKLNDGRESNFGQISISYEQNVFKILYFLPNDIISTSINKNAKKERNDKNINYEIICFQQCEQLYIIVTISF